MPKKKEIPTRTREKEPRLMERISSSQRSKGGSLEPSESSRLSDRDERILSALPLVRIIASQLSSRLPSSVTIDELVSAGHLGLIRAADRFSPEHGVAFACFAKHRILGEMLDFLRRLDPLSRIERRARSARPPDAVDLGPDTVSLTVVRVFEEASRIHAANESSGDFILQNCISRARACLSTAENRVIDLLFYGGWNSRDVAKQMGVHESRISQIRTAALCKLRGRFFEPQLSEAA